MILWNSGSLTRNTDAKPNTTEADRRERGLTNGVNEEAGKRISCIVPRPQVIMM